MEKSLMVNTEGILQIHPQITVKVHHMINVWEKDNGEIDSTVEMTDYILESFMGEPLRMIESDGGTKYQMYQRYRNMIYDLGIDLDELVYNNRTADIPAALIDELENDFRTMQENKLKVSA